MTTQFRKRLFYFFTILFIIFGAGAVFYSQGYRFTFDSWSVTKVGAVYIESYQGPLDISLNNTLYKDKAGLLKSGTLISGIIPKKYHLSVRKDGFLEYQKNIEVLPAQVSRFFNILLVPENPLYSTSTLTTSTTRSIVALSSSGILTHETSPKKTWILELLTPLEKTPTTTTTTPIALTTHISEFSKQKLNGFVMYAQNPNVLLATSSSGVYFVNLEKKSLSPLSLKSLPSLYTTDSDALYYIDSVVTTTPKTTIKKPLYAYIARTEFLSGATSSIPFITSRSASDIQSLSIYMPYIAYTLSDDTLFLYNTKEKTEQQLASSTYTTFSSQFSPDGKKLLYKTRDGKIHVYFLADELETANVQKGNTITLSLIHTQTIQSITWYHDSAHILIGYPDAIMIAEVTTQEPNNHFPLWRGSYRAYTYDGGANILTVSTPQTILRLDINSFLK